MIVYENKISSAMPSTVVKSFIYIQKTSELKITFVSGLVYNYKNVPEEVYHRMCTAFSKGSFFNKHIKDHYSFEKEN